MQIQQPLKERFLPFLLALLLPITAQAEQPVWYEVELIIFSHTDPRWDAEVWPQYYEQPELGRLIELGEANPELLPTPVDAGGPAPFSLIDETEMRLLAERDKLELSNRHQVLLHTGWRQPGLERDKALAVHIRTQRDLDSPMSALSEPAPAEDMAMQVAQEAGMDAGIAMNDGHSGDDLYGISAPEPVERINGSVRLILSRYLHLETALYYTPMESAAYFSGYPSRMAGELVDEANELDAPLPRFFSLEDSRRMRSRELHYIDHPLFGVLALVTPYEQPERPDSQPTAVNTGVQSFPLQR